MPYTFEQRTGMGVTVGWDSTGGTSYTVIGIVVDGDKTEAKASVAKTSLLANTWDTFSKTSVNPGEFKFTIVYDPKSSEYQALATNLVVVNALPPRWQLSFPDAGAGSGATTESFAGHLVGISREVKKDAFLMCDITVQITGDAGLRVS